MSYRHFSIEEREIIAVRLAEGASLDADVYFAKPYYSMCGLVFIMEFMDWTIDEAVGAYIYRADIQYALNLDATDIYLSNGRSIGTKL